MSNYRIRRPRPTIWQVFCLKGGKLKILVARFRFSALLRSYFVNFGDVYRITRSKKMYMHPFFSSKKKIIIKRTFFNIDMDFGEQENVRKGNLKPELVSSSFQIAGHIFSAVPKHSIVLKGKHANKLNFLQLLCIPIEVWKKHIYLYDYKKVKWFLCMYYYEGGSIIP